MTSATILSDNGVSSGSAGLKSGGGNDGVLLLQTTTSGGTATTAVTIDTSQNATFANRATFPTTIGVGAATPSTSGSGISFPATQSASSNANTLDDYEEGFWSPTYSTDATGFTSVTYNTTFTGGYYVKIGQLVFLTGYLRTESITKGSASGNVIINGLPFVVATSGASTYYRAQGTLLGAQFASNAPIQAGFTEGVSYIYPSRVNAIGSTSSVVSVVVADMATGANANVIQFGATYLTA
jgi:hypothetical protein